MAGIRNNYKLSDCTKLSAVVLAQLAVFFGSVSRYGRPNIILIVADDLGWNDVGWNNPHVKTPYLDFLALSGIILNSSYMQPVCSPSRAALLSGYYPFRVGLQHGAIRPMQPSYLPENVPILPEKLKQLGYATHMVGKWHLGFCNWKYTPTYRGFDSFFGFYNGGEGYFDHSRRPDVKPTAKAYDFRLNKYIYYKGNGTYSNDLFVRRVKTILENHDPEKEPLFLYLPFQSVHSPVEVPERYVSENNHFRSRSRRRYLGMVTALDDAVGRITELLLQYGYLGNSLIVFTTDNGGPVDIGSRNWPLRGGKGTIWEGGTRSVGFVYSPTLLKKTGYTHNGLIHAVDWYPTLLDVAGGSQVMDIDGVSQWDALRNGEQSPREEFVYNMDEISGVAALRIGDLKMVQIRAENIRKIENKQVRGMLKTWKKRYKIRKSQVYFDINRVNPSRRYIETHKRRYKKKYTVYQVFNITADPREIFDLAPRYPEYVQMMKKRLKKYKRKMIPSRYPPIDIRAHPHLFHGGVWSPGWC